MKYFEGQNCRCVKPLVRFATVGKIYKIIRIDRENIWFTGDMGYDGFIPSMLMTAYYKPITCMKKVSKLGKLP